MSILDSAKIRSQQTAASMPDDQNAKTLLISRKRRSWWVPAGLVLLLLAGAAIAFVRHRGSGASPTSASALPAPALMDCSASGTRTDPQYQWYCQDLMPRLHAEAVLLKQHGDRLDLIEGHGPAGLPAWALVAIIALAVSNTVMWWMLKKRIP